MSTVPPAPPSPPGRPGPGYGPDDREGPSSWKRLLRMARPRATRANAFAALPHDKGAFFVAVPTRVEDLRLVQQWQPGGTWQAVPRRFQAPQMDYYAYQVPPQVFVTP